MNSSFTGGFVFYTYFSEVAILLLRDKEEIMTNDEIKHLMRDLTEVHGSVDRAINWCECADEYITYGIENRPNIDCAIIHTVLSDLKNAKDLLQSYMTELEARKK